MATRYFVSFDLKDGINRPCGNTFYISEASFQEYAAAADDAARAATDVGVFQAAYMAMTDANRYTTRVGIEDYLETLPAPLADTVLRGNKLEFGVYGGGVHRDFAIPARTPASYSQSPDSLDVSITTPAAMSAFVAAYDAVVVDAFGNSRGIVSAEIVD